MIKRLIQSVVGTFGYRLVRRDSINVPGYGLEPFFALIKRHGFAPRQIIDAGANHGNWTRLAVKYFPTAHYTLVEPQIELKDEIQDLLAAGYQIDWLNAGVGDRSEVLTFHVDRSDQSSTFLQAPRTVGGAIRTVEVPVKTLNEIVAASGLSVPEMVKIDAEGFDLKALSGASDLFGKTDLFFAEVSIGQSDFENTPLAVIQKMTDEGYRLVEITDLNRSPKFGVLWLCEFAFLRNDSPLLADVTSYE